MADKATQTVRAYAKGVDQAPRKVAIVASLVRGRSVADALVILDHTPRRAALAVKKAIASASANASNNHGLDGKTLQISTISVPPRTRMHRISFAPLLSVTFRRDSCWIIRLSPLHLLVQYYPWISLGFPVV
jgi:ribosomal protein L22